MTMMTKSVISCTTKALTENDKLVDHKEWTEKAYTISHNNGHYKYGCFCRDNL